MKTTALKRPRNYFQANEKLGKGIWTQDQSVAAVRYIGKDGVDPGSVCGCRSLL